MIHSFSKRPLTFTALSKSTLTHDVSASSINAWLGPRGRPWHESDSAVTLFKSLQNNSSEWKSEIYLNTCIRSGFNSMTAFFWLFSVINPKEMSACFLCVLRERSCPLIPRNGKSLQASKRCDHTWAVRNSPMKPQGLILSLKVTSHISNNSMKPQRLNMNTHTYMHTHSHRV